MEVTVHFDDRDYSFDMDEIDLTEARFIKRNTGLSLLKFQEGLAESDPDCLALAYWIMRKQNDCKMEDPGRANFKVSKFARALNDAFGEAAEREAEAEAEGNPTSEPEAGDETPAA